MSDIGVIGNIVRFLISLPIMLFMCTEAAFVTAHCDINIMVAGFILLWLATFRVWK